MSEGATPKPYHETVAVVPDCTCFGCGAAIPERDAYCQACIDVQHAAYVIEQHAFDAYHAWADSCAKHSR